MRVNTEQEERFAEIYREFSPKIYHICLHYVQDANVANEIMQQTFVKVYERYSYEVPEKIKGYLAAVARNSALNYIRDSKHEVQSDIMEINEDDSENVVKSPEEAYVQSEDRQRRIEFGAAIFREIEEKNPNWYAILYMLFVLEMDYDEVAERLGVTKEVVYARLHRAKMWIRKKYGDEIEDILT